MHFIFHSILPSNHLMAKSYIPNLYSKKHYLHDDPDSCKPCENADERGRTKTYVNRRTCATALWEIWAKFVQKF